MRLRPSAVRPGTPPPELLTFNAADWPDDGPVSGDEFPDWPPGSPAVVVPLPTDLARQMRAWSRWTAARQAWVDEHGDRWPTGVVERWVEERDARPGGAR